MILKIILSILKINMLRPTTWVSHLIIQIIIFLKLYPKNKNYFLKFKQIWTIQLYKNLWNWSIKWKFFI